MFARLVAERFQSKQDTKGAVTLGDTMDDSLLVNTCGWLLQTVACVIVVAVVYWLGRDKK